MPILLKLDESFLISRTSFLPLGSQVQQIVLNFYFGKLKLIESRNEDIKSVYFLSFRFLNLV